MTVKNGKVFRTKFILMAAWLSLVALAFAPYVHALCNEQTRGAKGRITSKNKHELISLWQKGQTAEGHTIDGKIIIDIIRVAERLKIKNLRIDCAIIENGLDFVQIPPTPLAAVTLPTNWSDEEKARWIKSMTSANVQAVHIVKTAIAITSTEIKTDKQPRPRSINATRTFFSGRAGFDNATFSGEARFNDATFSREALFWNATFKQLAYFKETRFLQRLSLSGITIESYADFRDSEIMQLDFDNRLSPTIQELFRS